jgi:hypothetical protein
MSAANKRAVSMSLGIAVHTLDGFAIGTLCLIDTQPRTLTAVDCKMLREFVALIETEIHSGNHKIINQGT